jgi:ADP-ribosylglycohydrolase
MISSGLQFLRIWNICVAGPPGLLALFFPKLAAKIVWKGKVTHSDATQVLGAYWLSVAIISFLAGESESAMCTMGLVQMLYKSLYLAVVTFPAFLRGRAVLWREALLYLFNVAILLPSTLPWDRLSEILMDT